jgi:hypothetical protein
VHPGTSRRLPSGWRATAAGMWPVVAAGATLILIGLGVAGVLVWATS